MKINVNKKDAIWSYLAVGFNVGINIILIPVILFFLSDDNTALYYVFISLSAFAVMLDFGFSPAIARSMAYAWVGAKKLLVNGSVKSKSMSPNYELIKKITITCKFIYGFIALLSLFLALTIGTVYIDYIMRNSYESNYNIAWIIYAFAISLNIFFGYYSVFLRGIGAIYKVNVSLVASKTTQLISTIILLIVGFDIIAVSIGYLLCAIVFMLFSNKFFYGHKNMKDKLSKIKLNDKLGITKKILSIIWPNTWREGMGIFSVFLCNQSCTIIASLFLSLLETGIFSLATQLGSVLAMIAGTMYTTYEPSLQSAYANRDKNRQKNIMSFILLTYLIIFAVGLVLLLTIGLPIVYIIKPSYEIPILLMFFVAIYQGMLVFRNCYSTYYSTTNRLIYWKSYIISALICVVFAIVLCKFFEFGIWGLVGAQIFSQGVYNIWHWPIKVHQELNLKITEIPKRAKLEFYRLIKQNK